MMKGLDKTSGWTSDSVVAGQFVHCNAARVWSTLIANQIDPGSVLCKADGMILHAWRPSNVAENNDLCCPLSPPFFPALVSGIDWLAIFADGFRGTVVVRRVVRRRREQEYAE